MSKSLFGLPYDKLKSLIYPTPWYKQFTIAKRSGGLRIINAPSLKLKRLQRKLAEYLANTQGVVKPSVHGFAQGKSIVTNAKSHSLPRTKHILNIDIEDFFPSISFYRVRGLFQGEPFNFSYQLATVLAQLTTYKNRLPQGAPTSPIISNLICRGLDRDLIALAKENRAIYTRYCDDITISFSNGMASQLPKDICQINASEVILGSELKEIIDKNSFKLNAQKTRLSSINHRLEVTGLTVNKFPNVRRKFVDEIRGALNAWEKYGHERANTHWQNMPRNRQLKTGTKPALHRFLEGKLLYLKMVRGSQDFLYSKLAERFNNLVQAPINGDSAIKASLLKVSPVVKLDQEIATAVYVVEWTGNYKGALLVVQGTAFAYKGNALVTCDHLFSVKNGDTNNENVEIDDVENLELTVMNPLTRNRYLVEVLYRDNYRDLAVLKFSDATPPQYKYFIPSKNSVEIRDKVKLVGFPNYSDGRKIANQSETTVLNKFPMTGLIRVEVEATIRQGNSGGPLLDRSFGVVGVAQQGATQDAGNNQCLCVTELEKWLGELNLSF